MRLRRSLLAMALLALVVRGQVVPKSVRSSLETLAQDLAKGGWSEEGLQVAEILDALGHEPAAVAAVRQAIGKLQTKPPKTPTAPDRMAPMAKKAAGALTALLPTAADNDKLAIAGAALRLDDQSSDARAALGYRLIDNAWVNDADAAAVRRRGEIQDALARAMRLPIECATEESTHAIYQAIGVHGSLVRFGKVRVHSDWPAEKLTRVVRTTVRALAMSNYLTGGNLEQKYTGEGFEFLHFSTKAMYQRAIDWAKREGKLPKPDQDWVRVGGIWLGSETLIGSHLTEAEEEAALLFHLLDNQSTPCLVAGHANWLCRAMFGEPIPQITWRDEIPQQPQQGTITAREQQERAWRWRLAKAGITGARSWMAWLAERRQDPSWQTCFVDQVGKLQGDQLLKSTFACEYLYEREAFASVWKADQPSVDAVLTKTIGLPLASFDEAFRNWIVPPRAGLAQRFAAAGRPLPAEEVAALAKLNALRVQAVVQDWWKIEAQPEVRIDATLSAGARKHANYLRLHREQAAAWPDAHEEFPDHQGFSPEGAWAGGNSVISSGAKSLGEGIDGWMGTFYHRLPLLEPGLLQCGMASVDNIAVLDASSLCVPSDEIAVAMIWPPRNAKNVPLRFVPELPNPLPGVDQSKLGYPITIQYGEAFLEGGDLKLALHAGTASGAMVDCHLSTPSQPTNLEVVPRSAWCLMPKGPLQPNAAYTVVVDLGSQGVHEWSFHTAAK
jgi:uncharacterized protein YkwD